MNTHYKIDKDTVVVTDKNGKKRMMPKYTHIEDILVLENEIEQIEGEIAEKNAMIESNKLNKHYIGCRKYAKTVTIATLLTLLCAAEVVIANMIPAVAFIKYPSVIGLGLSFILDMVACYYSDKGRNLSFQNEKLEQEIDWLQQIKKQKEEKKEKFKRSINKKMLEREEKQLPEPIRPMEMLQKLEEILKMAKEDATVYPFTQEFVETELGQIKILTRF